MRSRNAQLVKAVLHGWSEDETVRNSLVKPYWNFRDEIGFEDRLLVLCARSQDLVMSVSVHRVHVVLSTLLDLRAEESRVVRHVKPPRCGEESR